MISLPWLDWPLRALAGSNAAWILHFLGYKTSLSLAHPDNPVLLLLVNGRTFEVAAECNGFGMITSTVLLALLMVACSRRSIFDKTLGLLLAAFLGFTANALRIVAICMTAPHFPDHYHLMHEVIGVIFFWGVLILVWFFLKTNRPPRTEAAEIVPVTARTS